MIQFQCLWVEAELYLTNKLTEKAMSRHVQLARYISELITQRYGTLGPSNSLFFSQGQNGSFFTSSDQTTIRELKGCTLSI